MSHRLGKPAATIDWRFIEERFGAVYSEKPGHSPLPTRLMRGFRSILSVTGQRPRSTNIVNREYLT